MRVLFVCSGNSQSFDVVPFIQVQADSLIELGVLVDFSTVKGKGAIAYLSHALALRKLITDNSYGVIHAHYSLCGFVASIAAWRKRIPVIVSLMGSDVKGAGLWLKLIRFFTIHIWDATIVKSQDMHTSLGVSNVMNIPNGIDLSAFKELGRIDCRAQLGMDMNRHYILFGADPGRDVKNYPLAKKTFDLLKSQNRALNDENCQLITLGSIAHEQIPIYLNATDVLILTSKWEGSPNIIKEAMACGSPIVCTDVGDVRWLLDGLDGCYIASQDPTDIAEKLGKALRFEGRTKGREQLIELGLDSESVAKKIIGLYEEMLQMVVR